MIFLHTDLFVKSMDEMLDFYQKKLGMRVVEDAVISGDLVKFVSKGRYDAYRIVLLQPARWGTMLELVQYLGENDSLNDVTQNITCTFWVTSLADKITELSAYGVVPASPIFNVSLPNTGYSKLVFYRDPEDNLVEYLEMIEFAK